MLNKKACMAYGSISLFTSLLHNIFLLYHVDIFLSIYKIDKLSFWIGEAIFLVWNSCNDPLFGWASDRSYLSDRGKNENIILNRVKSLQINGPLFSLSFLTFWFAIAPASLQFVGCLCVYDGFLTAVDLQHSALLADLAVDNDSRTYLNYYCSSFGVFAASSVFVSYAIWDHNNLTGFRWLCVVLAVVSAVGFYIATGILRRHVIKREIVHLEHSEMDSAHGKEISVKTYIKEFTSHRNFMWFSMMNIIQVFHCHFNSNFYPLFLTSLLADDVPQFILSFILGSSFVIPHLNNLYFLSACRKYGTYDVIKSLFCVKFALAVFMLIIGRNEIVFLCLFIASNRIFTEGTCKLLGLVISDLVDEDMILHERTRPVSALIFGTAAFLSKPGQTLAPLLGTWMLTWYTGHDLFESGNTLGSIRLRATNSNGLRDPVAVSAYKEGVFQLLCGVPIVCAAFQLMAWSRYRLRGAALLRVKRTRQRQYSYENV